MVWVFKANLAIANDPTVAGFVGDDGSDTRTALDQHYLPLEEGQYTFKGQLDMTPGIFTKPYDTDLWIAGAQRLDPTDNSQGLYIQHRVAGDLGGLVHDAGASELRLTGASNTGAGQAAHENSLVVTGGANDIGNMIGVLANFHTEGTPTGSADEVALFRADTIPALAAGFTLDRAISLRLNQQTVGGVNFTLYAPEGDSVLGPLVADDLNSPAVLAKAVTGQVANVFAVQNSAATTVFRVFANATAGAGGQITGTTFWINNNLASVGTRNLVLKAIAGQTGSMLEALDSADALKARINSSGAIFDVFGTSGQVRVRNAADSGTFVSMGATGFRWDDAGLQQTTVGAAGGAAALPATPVKYLKVRDSAGTTLVIPAYSA